MITHFFSPPRFSNPEKAERAATLFALVWIAIGLGAGVFVAIMESQQGLFKALVPFLVLLPMGLVALEISRRGHIVAASWLFIGTIIILATIRSLSSGGIRSPGVTMFYIFALAAGLLLGEGAAILVAGICALLGFGLIVIDRYGALPPETIHYSAFTYWWINVIYIGITLFLLSRASRSVRVAFDHAQVELGERRKAEADAIEIKNRLETLITEAKVGVLVFHNYKPLIANLELAKIFGFGNRKGILDIEDIRGLFPEEGHVRVTKMAEALSRKQMLEEVTSLRHKRNDGSWIQIECRSFPIEWAGKASICAIMTDVTRRLELEAQLRQSQRLEAVGQMTGGIAHDFNNLLTVILVNADYLERHAAHSEAFQRMTRLITKAAERGASLTKKLLAFSRRQYLDLKVTDVGDLVVGMKTLLRSALGESIHIEIFRAGNLWQARTDASELESAILNLAINARDAMPDGGSLTIEVRNVRLDVSEEGSSEIAACETVRSEYVLIAVSDTGIGMDENTRMRALDPFFTTKDVGKGSGLGLSTVYGFIAQLDGQMRIHSELGKGTRIELYLPRDTAAKSLVEVEENIGTVAGGTERILVVEDDEEVREQVVIHLAALGYQVSASQDGVEALELLRTKTPFDLLFTDLRMPKGVSGIDLANRARDLRSGLKVLFTSGNPEDLFQKDGWPFPASDMLPKPYRREELAIRIRAALDRNNSDLATRS